MKHVKKSVLLWYSAHEMYALVTDVPSYPQFLPWCERAEVLEAGANNMTARLSLAYGGVRHAFTTRNAHVPDTSVIVTLVDGPFSVLDGTWLFRPLGTPAGDDSQACRIEFDLRYAFSSNALEAVVSPVFDRIANTFVDSFVKRAEQVYGPR
jgi:ribosome-associated toxin RatA of RatAB toxin-antitoxin module